MSPVPIDLWRTNPQMVAREQSKVGEAAEKKTGAKLSKR